MRAGARRARRSGEGRFSPLTLRILAVNIFALVVLVGGVLYLDSFRVSLIVARTNSLLGQGEIIAGALGLGASSGPEAIDLDEAPARLLVRRLTEMADIRARLFDTDGRLIADTDRMGLVHEVTRVDLPPRDGGMGILRWLYDLIEPILPTFRKRPLYVEYPMQQASDYPEALAALGGYKSAIERVSADGIPYLSVAVPVTRFRKVLGGLMLSVEARDIDQAIRGERLAIMEVFAVALALTTLLSLFLARTIARPIHRLAEAAERVKEGKNRRVPIPDFSRRSDEIGDLSVSLTTMTQALYDRIDAIESFAADVAHELKNPLSSISSAIETASRAQDPQVRQRLFDIISSDVRRLDRLISEISAASRLDAELARDERGKLDLVPMLDRLVSAYADLHAARGIRFVFRNERAGPAPLLASEERMGHVFRNLIDNAMSFSPQGGTVTLTLDGGEADITIAVDDEGPGMPEEALPRVFERFYTERPGEHFGTHSGLGLAIARQIVASHHGTIVAMNRRSEDGRVLGARFLITLPVLKPGSGRRA